MVKDIYMWNRQLQPQYQTSKVPTVDKTSMSVYSQYLDVVYSLPSTSTVQIRLAYLLCRYFANNGNNTEKTV